MRIDVGDVNYLAMENLKGTKGAGLVQEACRTEAVQYRDVFLGSLLWLAHWDA